jgi:hypothetical protein
VLQNCNSQKKSCLAPCCFPMVYVTRRFHSLRAGRPQGSISAMAIYRQRTSDKRRTPLKSLGQGTFASSQSRSATTATFGQSVCLQLTNNY